MLLVIVAVPRQDSISPAMANVVPVWALLTNSVIDQLVETTHSYSSLKQCLMNVVNPSQIGLR